MRPDESKLITVLTTSDETVLAKGKSLLDDAEIEYFAKGEQVQNLFGTGNPALGPVELQVEEHNKAKAEKVLEAMSE